MKILYAVQATGNGHISRAMEILPYLKRYGQVDIFLSGANSSLALDAPVKYRSKGLCLFYDNTGSLSYAQIIRKFAPLRLIKEIIDLPVQQYDLVLNDFESITSLACAFKRVPSINFGHQASFISPKTPRPEKRDAVGEWILRNYARASQYLGLHFQAYDDFILPPIIKKEILHGEPTDLGHITVYLPAYNEARLKQYLSGLTDFRFQVFSKEAATPRMEGNIEFLPVNNRAFTQSLASCRAIITSAGFETPAEALYLRKALMVVPIKGQYEQLCNAAALEQMGVKRINTIDETFAPVFLQWLCEPTHINFAPDYSTEAIVEFLMSSASKNRNEADYSYPELVF